MGNHQENQLSSPGCLDQFEIGSKGSVQHFDVDVDKPNDRCHACVASAPGPSAPEIPCDAGTASSPDHISWEENSTTDGCETGSQFTPMNSWSEDDAEQSQVILK